MRLIYQILLPLLLFSSLAIAGETGSRSFESLRNDSFHLLQESQVAEANGERGLAKRKARESMRLFSEVIAGAVGVFLERNNFDEELMRALIFEYVESARKLPVEIQSSQLDVLRERLAQVSVPELPKQGSDRPGPDYVMTSLQFKILLGIAFIVGNSFDAVMGTSTSLDLVMNAPHLSAAAVLTPEIGFGAYQIGRLVFENEMSPEQRILLQKANRFLKTIRKAKGWGDCSDQLNAPQILSRSRIKS